MSFPTSSFSTNTSSPSVNFSNPIKFQKDHYFIKGDSGAYHCKKHSSNQCKGYKPILSPETSSSRLQAHAEKCFGIMFSSKRSSNSDFIFSQKDSVKLLLKWLICDAVSFFIYFILIYYANLFLASFQSCWQ